jgi:hypothetical protein
MKQTIKQDSKNNITFNLQPTVKTGIELALTEFKLRHPEKKEITMSGFLNILLHYACIEFLDYDNNSKKEEV